MSFAAQQATLGLSVTDKSQSQKIGFQPEGTSARITNASATESVFVSFGATAKDAEDAAVVPTPRKAKLCYHLLAMNTMIVEVPSTAEYAGFVSYDKGPIDVYMTLGRE